MDVKILNRYKLNNKIAERPGAELFVADDLVSHKKVCIKILNEPGNYKKLLYDLQQFVGIKHPNVNYVYEISGDDHNIFIVSDYLQGEDLKTKLINHSLETTDTFELLRKIVDGLTPYHEENLTTYLYYFFISIFSLCTIYPAKR